VTADIENRIIAASGDTGQLNRAGKARLSRSIPAETVGIFGLEARSIASGIERRLASERGGQRDVGSRVLESIERCRELFEPNSVLLVGGAELVVGGQDHQYVHFELPLLVGGSLLVMSVATAMAVLFRRASREGQW